MGSTKFPDVPARPSSQELFEREAELKELDEHVVGATRRQGAVLLLEGPAGIGKTALLQAARSAASERGMTVLAATGSELDREFAFGLVHQLIDPILAGGGPERREQLLEGVAALAAPVLLGQEAPALAGSDPGHAVLHGLYWLVANLAESESLALVVDDLHWGDRASLRFLEFLGRRLEGLPVLIVAATRVGEPGAEEDVLTEIRSGPAAQALRPSPLSDDAVTRLLSDALGNQPDVSFAEAAVSATGGNPLLVGELARAAAEQGLHGKAAEAPDLTGIVGAGVGEHVRRRLAALGPDATAVATAVALLGERSRLDDVAALADIQEPVAATAIDLLVQAGLLSGDAPQATGGAPSFVHPLVRAAVAAEIPPARRAALHATAGRRMAARDARPEEVALHLVAAEPAGDPWVVETLRAAAASVAAEGVPEAGIVHLRRALAEPAGAEDRVAILGELGTLEAAANRTEALEHLTQALDEGLEESARANALALRGRLRLFRDAGAALEDLEAAMRETTDPVVAVRIEAMMLDATMYDLAAHSRRAALLGRDGEPSIARLLHKAIEAGYAPDHRDEVEALARRAFGTGDYLAVLGPESTTLHLAVQALRNVELRDLSASVMDDMESAAREAGSRYGLYVTAHSRALWHWFFGSIGAAEADARRASELVREAQLPFGELACTVILAEALRERGALDDAEQLLDAQEVGDALLTSVTGADYLSARGLIHCRRGRRDEAEADLRRAHELLDARGWRNPLKGRATLRLAELLAERGDIEEARALAEADVAITSAAGLRGAHGMALRVLARTGQGDETERLLREAVAQLEESPLVHERAWALHDLGAHLRRAGRRADARTPLRAALELAERHESGEVAALAREELLQSGARPRRSALSGPESLTPSERRVAELAARGLSNREIAETLWVSRKTVEVHLGHTYAKLDISSRAELPVALAAS
jgi:DNA-binding CsgD family transcriptional regulator